MLEQSSETFISETMEGTDGEWFTNGPTGDQLLVVEQAIAPGPRELTIDRGVGDLEETGHLPQAGSLGGELGDAWWGIAPSLPTTGRAGVGGEAASAMAAAEAPRPGLCWLPSDGSIPDHVRA
jgi:hypothetical protein